MNLRSIFIIIGTLILIVFMNFRELAGSVFHAGLLFSPSILGYHRVEKIFSGTHRSELAYNQGMILYYSGNYMSGESMFDTSIAHGATGETLFRTQFARGNTAYYIGKSLSDTGARIARYEQALIAYTGANMVHTDSRVDWNYAFVEKLLQDEKAAQQSKEESTENSESGSGEQKKEDSGSGKTQSGTSEKPSDGGDTKKIWSNGNEKTFTPDPTSKEPLRDEDRESLQLYAEDLKNLTKQQEQFLNPDGKSEVSSSHDQIQQFLQEMAGFDPIDTGVKDW